MDMDFDEFAKSATNARRMMNMNAVESAGLEEQYDRHGSRWQQAEDWRLADDFECAWTNGRDEEHLASDDVRANDPRQRHGNRRQLTEYMDPYGNQYGTPDFQHQPRPDSSGSDTQTRQDSINKDERPLIHVDVHVPPHYPSPPQQIGRLYHGTTPYRREHVIRDREELTDENFAPAGRSSQRQAPPWYDELPSYDAAGEYRWQAPDDSAGTPQDPPPAYSSQDFDQQKSKQKSKKNEDIRAKDYGQVLSWLAGRRRLGRR